MADDVKNIFISHVHADDHRLQPLKDLLGRAGLTVRDGSINSDKPNNATNEQYIKTQILAPRIEWAGTLVVLVTPDTKDSEYVDWEIRYAEKCGKRIVGVWDHGEAQCELPQALEELADCMVGWQAERVRDAILGKTDGWEDAKGNPVPARSIKRHNC